MGVRTPRQREPVTAREAEHALLDDELVFAGQAKVLQAIAEGWPLVEVLDLLAGAIERRAAGMRASVLVLRGDQLTHGAAPSLPPAYTAAIDGLQIGPGVGSCGTAAYEGRLVVVEDVLDDPKWAPFRDLVLTHGFRACWSAPILASTGAVLGTFALYYDEPRVPTGAEIELIETAAQLAAIALERHQLDELRTRQRELELAAAHAEAMAGLARASIVINSQRSVEEMLSSITQQACTIIGAHQGSTSLTMPGTGEAEGWPQLGISVQLSDKYAPWREYEAPSHGARSYGLVCANNDVVRMTDEELKQHPLWSNFAQEEGRHPPMRGWLAAPLVASDGSNLGMLQLSDKIDGEFTEVDESIVVQLAQMASIAVEKAQLHQRTRQHVDQLHALTRASMAINSPMSLEQMLDAITEETASALGVHQVVVSLTDGEDWSQAITSMHLSERYAQWADYDVPPDGSGIYALVCRENRPMRLTQQELESHPAWRGFGAHAADHPPMRGWLAAPLVSRDGENLGLIQASDKDDGTDFTEADEALVVQIAQMASVAIEKAQLYELTAQQRQARLRHELLSGLSHDMQTPLATIRGLADVLSEDLEFTDPAHEDAFRALTRQTDHLYVLVQQFLDHLRLESHRELRIDPRPIDPMRPIRRVVELFEHQREVTLHGSLSDDARVLADPLRLQQVLANLVSNAVKYSDGPIALTVESDDGRMTVHVDDTGPGLPDPQHPEIVFERFYRGPDAGATPGTGLGLYIAREVTTTMGGELRAQNRASGGARFSLSLREASTRR